MTPKVICVSGGIGSGKTEVSRALAERLGSIRVSCGDYVRWIANAQGLGNDRDHLQALGEKLIATNMRDFCEGLLAYASWQPGDALVVDGVRHVEVLNLLRQLVAPVLLVMFHLGTPDEVRSTRLAGVRPGDAERLGALDEHSTEVQVKGSLRDAADTILDGSKDVDSIVAAALEYLATSRH